MTSGVCIKQNFDAACEAALNSTINAQLHASYVFLSMSSYCDRHDVAMKGVHKFLCEHSSHIREDSERLMKYLNERGGKVALQAVEKPSSDEWGSAGDMMDNALTIYKNLNTAYLQLHDVAESKDDPHLDDFIEDHLLGPTVERIKKLGDLITQLRRAGKGLGEYLFDQQLQS